MRQIREHYDLSKKCSDEVPIKIHELWLYPVRGVPGILVNQVELTDGGFRYDREWVIIREKDKKPLASHNSVPTMFLRAQVFNADEEDYSIVGGKPQKLVLSLKDNDCYPEVKLRSCELRFDRDYSGY